MPEARHVPGSTVPRTQDAAMARRKATRAGTGPSQAVPRSVTIQVAPFGASSPSLGEGATGGGEFARERESDGAWLFDIRIGIRRADGEHKLCVVPANAGTHTPCKRLAWGSCHSAITTPEGMGPRSARAFGSLGGDDTGVWARTSSAEHLGIPGSRAARAAHAPERQCGITPAR